MVGCFLFFCYGDDGRIMFEHEDFHGGEGRLVVVACVDEDLALLKLQGICLFVWDAAERYHLQRGGG